MSGFRGWEMQGCAHILSLTKAAEFARRTKNNGVPVILTSGGFDPIHSGHISYLRSSLNRAQEFHQKVYGRFPTNAQLIVAVNSDTFLTRKKGKAFMPLVVRCQVVSAVVANQYNQPIVVPFIPSNFTDMTVCEAIEVLRPTYFCKGGDRTLDNIPEVDTCEKTNTKIITGCGDDKYWSSSNFLKEYREYVLSDSKQP